MFRQKQHVTQDALRVFVSSRMEELAPEREAVRSALDAAGFDPWLFEADAGARALPPRETYLNELANSDVYIGVFWKSLGKYTEDEFRAAGLDETPRLVYEKVAAASDRTAALQAFLDEVGHVERGLTIRRFHEADELESIVPHDLERVQSELVRVGATHGGTYTGTRYGGRYDRTAAHTPLLRDPLATTDCGLPPDPLVDRHAELDRARATISAGERLLGFAGEPGIGKTAVLRSLAHEPEWTTESFPAGVGLCLDAGQSPHVEDLLRAVWSALYRVGDRRYVPDDRELRNDLAGKRALILVDDLGLPPDQVSRLSESMPRSVFVVASADECGPSGLSPLAFVKAIPLDGFEAANDMVAVFAAAYGGSLPHLIEAKVAALCRDVQGSPGRISKLAHEAWGRGGDLANWVQERADTPVGGTLRARLSRAEIRALLLLAAFGSDAATPTGVAHRLGITAGELATLVGSGDLEETRSHVLTGATYVGVSALGRPEEMRGQVFDATVDWVDVASPEGIEQSRGFILRVLAWGVDAGRNAGVVALARALDQPLALAGAWGSWGVVVDLALDAATELGDDGARAWALHEKGTRALMLGERRAARRSLKKAHRLRTRLGEPSAAAVTSHNLGFAPFLPPFVNPVGLAALATLVAVVVAGVLFMQVLSTASLESGSTVTTAPVNRPPRAEDSKGSVAEGASVEFSILSDDTDPDNAVDELEVIVVSTPQNGQVEGGGEVVTYVHDGSETTTDSFTYLISDGEAESNEAIVTITIEPVNDPPEAADHDVSVNQDGSVTIDVLADATDLDNSVDDLTVDGLEQPGNGKVEIHDGALTYHHDGSSVTSASSRETISFTYRLSDGQAVSNDATVTITVNRPPVAFDQSVVVLCGATTIELEGSDPDGDPLEFSIVNPPSRGTLGEVSPLGDTRGLVVYMPSTEADDSFTFSVSDGEARASGIVDLEVICIP